MGDESVRYRVAGSDARTPTGREPGPARRWPAVPGSEPPTEPVDRNARDDLDAEFPDRAAIETPPDPGDYTVLRRIVTAPENRVVVSLGGGAVPGFCGNAALVEFLDELGLGAHVDAVWGTSAGAIVGGGWASGTPARELFANLRFAGQRGGLDMRWRDLVFALLLRPFGRRLPDGLIAGRHFRAAIRRGLSVEAFEDCRIPFRCIACTDVRDARRVVFDRGPLLPAISASMALPGVLLPCDARGRPTLGWFDGGLVEKTPLRSPIAEHNTVGEGRRLVLLGTHFRLDRDAQQSVRGFLDRFVASIDIQEAEMWKYQHAEAAAHPDVTLLVVDPDFRDPEPFDFDRIDAYRLRARRHVKERLADARLMAALALP